MALIPLVPAGMWTYARVATVDRVAAVAGANAILQAAPPPAGARLQGTPVVYEQLAWQGERSLVPVSGYTVSSAYRLRQATTPAALVRHYTRALPGWTRTVEPVDCRTFSLPAGCNALYATFRRNGGEVRLNAAEYMRPPSPNAPSGTLDEFALDVSQKP